MVTSSTKLQILKTTEMFCLLLAYIHQVILSLGSWLSKKPLSGTLFGPMEEIIIWIIHWLLNFPPRSDIYHCTKQVTWPYLTITGRKGNDIICRGEPQIFADQRCEHYKDPSLLGICMIFSFLLTFPDIQIVFHTWISEM